MKLFKIKHLIAALAIFTFISCDKDEDQAGIDDKIISDYLSEHNIDAKKHSSGLYFIITKEGTGMHPNSTSTVNAKYKGYLTNGEVFDENTATFNLQNVINGWQIGIPYFREGGEGKLFIPSGLAYGSSVVGSIPANSVLIFDITLNEVR